MRKILLLILWHFGLLAAFADVVTLTDGRQISGSVESGNTQELHIKVGDQSQTIDIHEVQAIQLGVSFPPETAATRPPKAATPAPITPETAPAEPNNLYLSDGTHIPGRWWSIDATDMHFLVNDQLKHYPRHDVSGLTFGNATLPARSTTPPASTQAPASTAQPPRVPTLARSSAAPPPQPPTAQPPTLTRPSGSAPPLAPSRGLSQPEEIGMVYFWNGKVLIPLERTQAVEHKKGSTQYFEMPAPRSPVRLSETASLVFILRLPQGVDPAGYILFQLVTVDGSRRTRSQPGRQGGLMTWSVDIAKNSEAGLMTYNLTVRDLPPGEWSFSPSSTNDAYCFGVDPSAPGQ